jgi:uncharacterized protein involved in exopolysaccharide biosynthesis
MVVGSAISTSSKYEPLKYEPLKYEPLMSRGRDVPPERGLLMPLKEPTVTGAHEPLLRVDRYDDTLQIAQLSGFWRRQWWICAAGALLLGAASGLYLLLAEPRFTAQTSVLLQNRRLQLFQQQPVAGDSALDLPGTETQVEVIRSEAVAEAVVNKLGLTRDPEFTEAPSGFTQRIISFVSELLGAQTDYDDVDPALVARNRAVSYIRDHVDAGRVGRTYVLQIRFTAASRSNAVRVANGIAQAYIDYQVSSKIAAARQANIWLQERVTELREEAISADKAAQELKTDRKALDVASARQAQVTLRVLENSAQAFYTLYGTFLQKLIETTQDFSLPEALILNTAQKATRTPRPANALLVGAAAGVALGFAIGVIRELMRAHRMRRQWNT